MPLWSLFLFQAALPPNPPAVAAPPPCPTPPDYSFSDWELTREEHQFQGEWVVQYLYYSRTKTDECRDTSSRQSKVEGPYRLWPAVPANRVADVNRPEGATDSLSGSPLRSSSLPGTGVPGPVGPNPDQPASKTSGAPANRVPVPSPFFPGFILLAGVLVATRLFRRRTAKQDPVPARVMEPVKGPTVEPVTARPMDSIKPNTEWALDPAELAWLQAFFGIEERGYGTLTKTAVKRLQDEYKIPVDPQVNIGPNTYRALWKEHINLVHEHWQYRAKGQTLLRLERVMDSPLPPDLRAEMERLNYAYAANWAAVEGRYQAILRRDPALVAGYDEQIAAFKSSGLKVEDIEPLRAKYQPLIDALYIQAEKVKKDAKDGDYAKLLAMLAAADAGRWEEVASAKATGDGRWDAFWGRDAKERELAKKVADVLAGFATGLLPGVTAGGRLGEGFTVSKGESPTAGDEPKAPQLTLSQALQEAVDEYLAITPAIPYELAGPGNKMSASDYGKWTPGADDPAPPGIDCSGYVLQLMKRVSRRMGWPDPEKTVFDNTGTHLDQKLVAGATPVALKDVRAGDLLDWDGVHIMMVISRTENADGTVTLGITDSSDTSKWGEGRGPKKGTFTFPASATTLTDGFLNLPGYGSTSKHLGNNPYKIYRPTYWLGNTAQSPVTSTSTPVAAGVFWASIPEKAPDISQLPSSLKKFGWNQQKVNAVWDYCRTQGVDPRLILAIIPQEGTGSWNTSSSNTAADGQNGFNANFSEDLELAVGHVRGKFAFYGAAMDKGFGTITREHGLSTTGVNGQSFGNVIQFINWFQPMDKHDPPQGFYANHASWCKNVAQYYKDMGGDVDALSMWVAETFTPTRQREFTLRFIDSDVTLASGWTGTSNRYKVVATGEVEWRDPDRRDHRELIQQKVATGEWVLIEERTPEPAVIAVFQ